MAKKQIGDIDYNVEFNDSVLSTKTWGNARYDGCETKTQVLNKFTEGDISYGKKTAVQKYSRNIYIGERIIGYLDDLYLDLNHTIPNTGSYNTGKYTGFRDWSYVILKSSYTVNEDDSLEQSRKYETILNESADGLAREFKSDFVIGSKCNIINYSENVDPQTGLATSPKLESQYIVQFNKGLLGKIAEGNANNINYDMFLGSPNSGKSFEHRLQFNAGNTGDYGANAFYIEPSSSFNTFYTDISGSGYIDNAETASGFFEILGDRERTLGEKYAIKFFSTSSEESAFVSNTYGPESKLLFELSFITRLSSNQINATVKNVASTPLQEASNTPNVGSISMVANSLGNDNFVLYRINENINSLIVNLPRKRDLPGGIEKFIVLPENIHPFIKDNINYFASQIGLISGNQNQTINPKNRQLS